jgi:hypothetical protein
MRVRLLCCLAVLCGGKIAHAQQWPAYPANGSYPGYYAAPYGNAAMGAYPTYPVYNPSSPAYNYSTNYPQYPPPTYSQPRIGHVNPPQTPYMAPPPASLAGISKELDSEGKTLAGSAATDRDKDAQAVPQKQVPLADLAGDDDAAAAPRDADPAPARPQFFWFTANYTLSFFRTPVQPGPLVTAGAAGNATPGAIGQPNTTVLFGNNLNFNPFQGVRLDAWLFLDRANRWSMDWNGLLVTPTHQHFSAASDGTGNPLIARPVINAVTGAPTSYVDSSPGFFAGGATVDNKALLIGTELNLRYNTDFSNRIQANALAGFRFLDLNETLSIQDNVAPLVPLTKLSFLGSPVTPPDALMDQDRFRTRNYFYGPQLGGQLRWQEQWFFANVFGKVGLGVTQQNVNINGSTTLSTPAATQTAPGGILAQTTNMGSFRRDVFGVIPEFGLNVGIQANQYVRLMVGYSFLFWNSVVRPGAQIDNVVNPGLVPTDITFGTAGGPSRPTFNFKDELFWVQTFNVGVQITY